jgi:hypothetical protein
MARQNDDGPGAKGRSFEECDRLLSGMIDQQRVKVLRRARELMPGCGFEDVMNPDGLEPLRGDALFNYEDGILAGLIAAQAALRAGPPSGPLPPIHD